ncbi:MAG: LysM peptidoglycan-binding domain-containing protein [Phycisphaerae bacterium]
MGMLRKDVKIGLAVGSVVAAGFAIYILVSAGDAGPGIALEDGNGAIVNDGARARTDSPANLNADMPPQAMAVETRSTDAASTPSRTVWAPPARTEVIPPDPSMLTEREVPGGGTDPWAAKLGEDPQFETTVTPSAPGLAEFAVNPNAARAASFDSPDRRLLNSSYAGSTPLVADATTAGSARPGYASYVVQPGDNYSRIARKLYGNADLFYEVQKANPNVNPRALQAGQVLLVPDRNTIGSRTASAAAGSTVAEAAPAVLGTNEYRIRQNDSLWIIAQRELGDGTRHDEIYQLNKAAIGPDPTRLRVGTVIRLPK